MTPVPALRLTGGLAMSFVVHALLIGACLLARPGVPRPLPPVYQVHIVAAPAGAPVPGTPVPGTTVQAGRPPKADRVPQPTTPVHSPAVTSPSQPRTTKGTAAKSRGVPAPAPLPAGARQVRSPTAAHTEVAPRPAGGSLTGGNGNDVASVDTPGIEFDFPAYTNNIVSQLVRRFGPMQGTLSATVRFVIRRDGSVDLESIRIANPSRNYDFDQRAVGAVESAATARAFGPLPTGFREDILAVTFRFSPSAIR